MTLKREKGLAVAPQITGLTGGMGSGKSCAARFLCRHFSLVSFSADAIVHELLQPGAAYWQVIAAMDKGFIRPDQTVDKRRVRDVLFSNAALRREINEKIHPMVHNKINEKILQAAAVAGHRFFLVEVPLLFEAGWQDMFSHVVVVFAAPEKCAGRIMQRDSISLTDAEKQISAQWPLVKKSLLADHVIDNTGSWADTMLQLFHLGRLLWKEK